jgi:hypothetical protein
MNWRGIRNVASLLASLIVLVACGGGGGGIASGGTGGTGISAGAITGFGSIFVNGVEFSTSGATITRNDASISESELREGMVVEVQGSISGGTADTVTVEEAVRGPVESVSGSASAGILVVLGQTVQIDDTTVFDNNVPNFGAVTQGMLLEVHGLRRPDGSIVASFVEEKSLPVVFAVRGVVADHNALSLTFKVGSLTVNYGSAVISDMPAPSGSNWNDLFVEVKGEICSGNPVCGTLTATKVEPEGLGVPDANEAEIEGFVTALVSTSDFTLDSQRVVTTGSTEFLGGLQDEIVLGVKLEVEGNLAGGVLTATKVKFEDSVRIESNATVSGSTITVEGLPGITVTANAFTEFKSTTATAANLAPLHGRNVRIRGRASGSASVIAAEIEDNGPSVANVDVILQGNAVNVSNPTFDILGVTVDTSSLNPNTDFQGVNDSPITPAEFYGALTPNGGLVKAKGRLPAGGGGNVLAAGTLREVELED